MAFAIERHGRRETMNAMTPLLKARRAIKLQELTEMPVHNFKIFMQLLAEYDLWDEMEDHLKSEGCTTFIVGVEPLKAIGDRLRQKISSGALPGDLPWVTLCGSNGPLSPGTAPKTPPSRSPDGGTGGGGGPPDGGAGGGTAPDGGVDAQ
jgi:hypothetical protein